MDNSKTVRGSRPMNEQMVEFRRSGAEDFLGHGAIVRVCGNNVVVVMFNGDRDGVEWAPDVATSWQNRWGYGPRIAVGFSRSTTGIVWLATEAPIRPCDLLPGACILTG
jgi:hypothetical protein